MCILTAQTTTNITKAPRECYWITVQENLPHFHEQAQHNTATISRNLCLAFVIFVHKFCREKQHGQKKNTEQCTLSTICTLIRYINKSLYMYIHFGLDETIQCSSEQRRRIFLLYIALCHKFATIFIQKSHTNVMYNLLYCSNGSGNECAQDTLLQGCHSFGVRLSVGVHMQYPCFSSMDQEENLCPPSPWTIQHSRCMTFKWTTSRICIDSHRSCIFILFFLRNFSLFTLSLSHIFLHSINNWQMIRYLRCFDVFHTVLQWWICTVFVLSKEPPLY